MKQMSMVLLVVGVLAAVGAHAQDPARMLREAINKETVDGDCKGAIDQYKKVAAGSDRALAAQALLRMADCHQKLGNAEATKIYQQIISAYSTMPEAGQARQRLSVMGAAGSAGSGKADRIVWTTPTAGFPLAVSHDGRRLVYTDADGINLILHEFESGTTRPLTQATLGDMSDDSLSFSRDGKQLAYMWFNKKDNRDELRVLAVDGPATQTPRVLVARADITWVEPYTWTADGQWLAAVIDRPDRSSQLALVSTRDGSLRVLQSFRPTQSKGGVSISPDDRHVAFHMSDDAQANSDVFIIGMDGTGATTVVQHRAMDRVIGWTADGTRLVLTSDRSGSQELMALPVRDGRAAGPAQSLQDFERGFSLGLTSNGALYYTKRGGQPVSDVKLASLEPRTGQLTSPMTDLVKEYLTGSVRAPDFSPDSKSIAYIVAPARAVPAPTDLTLAVRSLETGSVRALLVKLRTVSFLRWSPDGSALAAFGLGEFGLGLWRIDATSGAVTLIAKQEPKTTVSYVRWSGDGRKIAYRRQPSGSTEIRLHEYDVISGADRELFHIAPGSAVADPHISPDFRTIYYRRAIADGGTAPFQVSAFIARDIATGTERELIRRNLGGTNLSPDGRYIITGTNDQATKTRSLLVVPVDGGPVRELMRMSLPQTFLDRTSLVNPLGVYKQGPGSDVIIASKDFGMGTTIERSEYWWVPIDGRPATLLDVGRISELRISADGRRIAIMPTQPPQQRNPVEIHVLERFLPVK